MATNAIAVSNSDSLRINIQKSADSKYPFQNADTAPPKIPPKKNDSKIVFVN